MPTPPPNPPARRRRGPHKTPKNAALEPQVQPKPSLQAVLARTWPFYGLLLLLTIGPLFRGLFFPIEQLTAFCIVAALAVVNWKRRFDEGDYRWFARPLDYATFGLFVVYCLATVVPADYQLAVQADVVWLMYFLTFWLVADFVRDATNRGLLYRALAVAGVLVSLIGIGAATGVVAYNGAYVSGRIYSSFQYPNATAAYLIAVLFPTLAAADTSRRWWSRALWMAAGGLDLLVFFLAYSRGALLVMPAAFLAYWLLLPAGRRGIGAVRMLLPVVVGVAFLKPVQTAFNTHAAGHAWLLALAAAVLVGAVDLAISGVVARAGERRTLLGATVLGLLGLAGGVALGARHLHGTLGRLTQLNLNTYNAWSRIQWSRDALRIWLTRPILGYGGGGWQAVYSKFQSYGYFSTEAHDIFAQTLVATGIIGLLAWLLLWVLGLRAVLRVLRRGDTAARLAVAPAAAGALMLGLHGAIDFTLSLSAISLALFALFGVVRALEAPAPAVATAAQRRRQALAPGYDFWRRAATYAGGCLAILGALSFLAGQADAATAAQWVAQNKGSQALTAYKTAIAYDPLDATSRAELATLEASSGATGTVDTAQVQALFQSALRLSPFNPQVHDMYGSYLLTAGQAAAGVTQFQEAMALGPFRPTSYEALDNADIIAAADELNAGQKGQADVYLHQATLTAQRLKAQAAKVPPQALKTYPLATTTPQLQLDGGEADLLLGQTATGIGALRSLAAQKGLAANLQGQALLWLGAAEQSSGQAAQGAKDLAAAKKVVGTTYAQELPQVQKLLAKVK